MWRAPQIQLGQVRGISPHTLRVLRRRLRRVGRYLGVDPEALEDLGVRIVDDEEMSRLHVAHMGEEGPTDVLSFPSDEDDSLGDIALDWQAVARQARTPGRAGQLHEATVLLVHGLVHLLGYDHVDRAGGREMHRLEKRALRHIGVPDLPRPYGVGR